MADWIVLIVIVSLISSVCSLLITDEEGKRCFGFLTAVVIMFVIFIPIGNTDSNFVDFDLEIIEDYSLTFSQQNDETIMTVVENGYKIHIEDILKTYFPEENYEDVYVEVDRYNDEYTLDKVEITFGREGCDEQKICERIYEISHCNCEVVFIYD